MAADPANDDWHIDKAAYTGIVRAIVERERPSVDHVEVVPTWGPTIVMAIRLSDGAKLVFKASGRQDIHAEAAACRLALRAGVPAPRVIALGEHHRLPGRRWYLMSRLPGVPWSDLRSDPARDSRILDRLAVHFAALHSTRASRHGPITDEAGGSFPSWQHWLRHGFAADTDRLASTHVAAAELRDLAGSALTAVAVELAERPAALIHGDLGDGEIFLDPRTDDLTGIADWGSAIVGDPLYDFARFVAGGPADDPRVPRLLPGLRVRYAALTGIDWDRHRRLVDLYDAHNAISNAVWALCEGVDWVDSLLAKAERLLGRVIRQTDGCGGVAGGPRR